MLPLYLEKLTPTDLKERSEALHLSLQSVEYAQINVCQKEPKEKRENVIQQMKFLFPASVLILVKNHRWLEPMDRGLYSLQTVIFPVSSAKTMISVI